MCGARDTGLGRPTPERCGLDRATQGVVTTKVTGAAAGRVASQSGFEGSGHQRRLDLYTLSEKPVEYRSRFRANLVQVGQRDWRPARQQSIESLQLPL